MPRISAKICLGATVACLATKFGAEFAVEHFPETHTTQKLKAIVLIDENKTDERSGKPYRLLTLEPPPSFQCKVRASEVTFVSSPQDESARGRGRGRGRGRPRRGGAHAPGAAAAEEPGAEEPGPAAEEDAESVGADDPLDADDDAPEPAAADPLRWTSEIEEASSQMIDPRLPAVNFDPQIAPGRDASTMTLLDLFILFFPTSYLESTILPHMNQRGKTLFEFARPHWRQLGKGEFFRFIGYILLISLCPFTGPRSSLWSTGSALSADNPFEDLFVPQNLGRHGMSRNRFEQIMAALVFIPIGAANPQNDPLHPIRQLHLTTFDNQTRQGSSIPSIEDAWQTKQWPHRSFAFILGVTEANVMHAYNFLHPAKTMDLATCRKALSWYLVHNPFIVDDHLSRQDDDDDDGNADSDEGDHNSSLHGLVAMKPHSKYDRGSKSIVLDPSYPYQCQRRCKSCPLDATGRHRRTSTYCICNPAVALCRDCFAKHVQSP